MASRLSTTCAKQRAKLQTMHDITPVRELGNGSGLTTAYAVIAANVGAW